MNIFEGSRRISYLILAAILITGTVLSIKIVPYFEFYYTVTHPKEPAIKTDSSFCNYPNQSKYREHTSAKGHLYTVYICFIARDFGEGKMLIPYDVNEDGIRISGDPVLESTYMDNKGLDFKDELEISNEVDDEYLKKWINLFFKNLGLTILSCTGFYILTIIVGWVVRGFAGIPMGKDIK